MAISHGARGSVWSRLAGGWLVTVYSSLVGRGLDETRASLTSTSEVSPEHRHLSRGHASPWDP